MSLLRGISMPKKLALVLNSGSSSIKFGLFELRLEKSVVRASSILGGQVERIGVEARLSYDKQQKKHASLEPTATDHERALQLIGNLLSTEGLSGGVEVVAHRVVHGGSSSAPALLDEEAIETIKKCTPLAPLHNPPALRGIASAKKLFPQCPHVAVFDTAFHATMKPETYSYAVPKKLGIRKYGFHGTSYASVVSKVKEKFPRFTNLVVAHLGNGASMACVSNGECVDTTMGLTPLEGLVMGTRCGDLDAGVVAYMQRELGYSVDEVDRLLNKQSGLLGLSGVSSDMREVKDAARAGNDDAILARKVYVERVRKYLGSYVVKLGGKVDAIAFTAGVGEHDADLRADVCANLEALGIALDPLLNANPFKESVGRHSAKNNDDDDHLRRGTKEDATREEEESSPPRTSVGGGVFDVSAKFSSTKVLVVKTNEEERLALEAAEVARLFEEEKRLVAEAKKTKALEEAKALGEKQRTSRSLFEERKDGVFAPFNSRGLYVDGVGPTAGEEVGLLYQLLPYGARLGYFRPFANENDRKLRTIRELFAMDSHPIEAMRGATVSHARAMLAAGREEELLDEVVAKFVDYSNDKDFVLVSRGHLGQVGDAFWTAKVAAALSVPVVYVVHDVLGDDTTDSFAGNPRGVLEDAECEDADCSTGDISLRERSGGKAGRGLAEKKKKTKASSTAVFCERVSEVAARVKEAVDARGGRLAGLVATLPRKDDGPAVADMLDLVGVYPAALFPPDERFSNISLEEIAVTLGAKVLLGTSEQLASSYAKGVVVATRFANETLEQLMHMPPGQLLVTHAARTDILMAVAMAQQSPDFPGVSGICFTGADGATFYNGGGGQGSSSSESSSSSLPADLSRALALLKRVPNAVRLPPVVAVDGLTFDAANAIHEMTPVLLPSSHDKIEAAQVLFETHLDPAFRRALVDAATTERDVFPDDSAGEKRRTQKKHLDDDSDASTTTSYSSERQRSSPVVATPKLFQHRLFSKARTEKQTIVLPEGNDRRVVTAAAELVDRGLANVVILGDPDFVRAVAVEARVEGTIFPTPDLNNNSNNNNNNNNSINSSSSSSLPSLLKKKTVRVVDPKVDDETRRKMIEDLVRARKHKGMTPEAAETLLKDDPNYYGTMLLHLGLADGMVSGACHSTAATMRPPLQVIRMKPGFHIVSSVFFMLLADGVKLFGDCAINVSPSTGELAQIAAASASTARAFGIEPRVAMLSYATGDSNTGELIDKVRDATAKAREMRPDDLFEGPIQFDAAVDPAVAEVKYKGKKNQVAGQANTLIFPSLDAGNSAYKAVQQASKCIAIGPIMQGLRLPVNDLSRGCTVSDIVNTVVVTAIQAQAGKQEAARGVVNKATKDHSGDSSTASTSSSSMM